MLAAAVRTQDALGLLDGKSYATRGLPERVLPELMNGPVGHRAGRVASKPQGEG